MGGLIHLHFGENPTLDYARATFKLALVPRLTLCMHMHHGHIPGLSLTLASAEPRVKTTSILLAARWVDERGGMFEVDRLHTFTVHLGEAMHALKILIGSASFAEAHILPLVHEAKTMMLSGTATPIDAPRRAVPPLHRRGS